MDVKQAVRAAKNYVQDLLADEGIFNLGLEEVEHDDLNHVWNVTVGFSRPWNSVRNALVAFAGDANAKRAYKVVRVRESDGEVVSVKLREILE